MKILQINCVYKNGSTGKIVYDLHSEYINKGIESYVIYGRGKSEKDVNIKKCASELLSKSRNIISRFSGNLYGMAHIPTLILIRDIKVIKPDVVHLHCINGYFCNIYQLIEFLKKNKIPTVITLHAEFMYTGNCGYAFDCNQWIEGCNDCKDSVSAIGSKNTVAVKTNWKKMYKAFDGFSESLRIVGVSDWITERAKRSQILGKYNIRTILNGLNTDIFHYIKKNDSKLNILLKIKNENKKILLFVTPYFEDENKGGNWILKLAKLIQHEQWQIVVVGNRTREYGFANVTFLGRIDSQEQLAALYSLADVSLLVSKRETFSMVTAESLCCGTPIIGFEAGAPEKIAVKEYSSFVKYGDIDLLYSEIKLWIDKEFDKEKASAFSKNIYSYRKMAENYIALYKELTRVNI